MAPANDFPDRASESPSKPSSPAWLSAARWIAGISAFLLVGSLFNPAGIIRKRPVESHLLNNVALYVKSYAWEHHGLWPTNWTQITNSLYGSQFPPRYHDANFPLQDHYLFIPHKISLEIQKPEPLRIVMLRATPKKEHSKSPPGRYAIAFPSAQDPSYREFTELWIPEYQITNLLARTGITLPRISRLPCSRFQ